MSFSIPTTYNHGARRIIDDSGPRPVVALDSATIGIVGTAPTADASVFPLDTPVAILGDDVMAALGTTGTLPEAIGLIFAQIRCRIVVIRVDEGATAAATLIRCIEANVAVPESWRAYRQALRAVIRGESDALPDRPNYPEGT